MAYKRIFENLSLGLLTFLVNLASADEQKAVEEPSFGKSAWEKFKSPITTDAKFPLMYGTLATGMLLVFEDQIIDPAQEETTEHKPLGSFSKIGDIAGWGAVNAAYVAGMLTYGLVHSNQNAKDNATGMIFATAYATLVTTVLKYTIREPRPDSNERESFPSGHTTAAFSFAAYVGCRHSLPWGIAAYSLAAFTGFSRMNDNRHYLHDVMAGGAVGTSYGLGVCLAENNERKFQEKSTVMAWYAAPVYDGVHGGLALSF